MIYFVTKYVKLGSRRVTTFKSGNIREHKALHETVETRSLIVTSEIDGSKPLRYGIHVETVIAISNHPKGKNIPFKF